MADIKFGELLVSEGIISQSQLDEALRIQKELKTSKPIGQLLVERNILTQRQLNFLLDKYSKRPQLGEILVKNSVITDDQLEIALEHQKKIGLRLGETLLSLRFVTEEVMREALSLQLNIPFVDLDKISIDHELKKLVTKEYAKRLFIVPIAKIGSSVTMAMDDPTDFEVIEELQRFTGFTINAVTAKKDSIKQAFARLYEEEPMREAASHGRIDVITDDQSEFRVRSRYKDEFSIEQLGFSRELTEKLSHLLDSTSGIILITGPTGSGKSTTLYGALMTLFRPGIKILTAEEPIEYVYESFIQCEVNEKIGNTFASYLRAFLRHDPQVIMLGEIRDEETAEMAFRAAQTGHLLLSTMHTNDAVSSVMRLLDLGIDRNILTSSLLGVLSQRLTRKVCQNCKEEYKPPKDIAREFFSTRPKDILWYKGRGCPNCNFTGFKERIALGELWIPNQEDVILINKGAPFEEIRSSSFNSTLFFGEDAVARLRQGATNMEELIRTLPYSSICHWRQNLETQRNN